MKATPRAYLAWVVVCLVWGTTYLAIRISLETIPPLLMAAFRWIAAGTILIGILKARGERLPGPRSWPALGALGILLLGFGNGGVVWAEQTVPSGLAAVLAATTPFWLVGIDTFMADGEASPVAASPGSSSVLPATCCWCGPRFMPPVDAHFSPASSRYKSPASGGLSDRPTRDGVVTRKTSWPPRRSRCCLGESRCSASA